MAILVEDRTVLLDASAEQMAGIRAGDLVEFSASGGRLAYLRRIGGPGPRGAASSGDSLRWRRPGAAPSRMALLRLRHQVTRALRAFLDSQGFVEVDTPALVRAPSPEPQFAPIAAGSEFLITSPEFQLKRMLTGGMERIYRLGPVFRGGERGAHHNLEFTLLEWYRAGQELGAMADDLAALLRAVAPLAEAFAAGQAECAAPRLRQEWTAAPLPQVTVAELFQRHLGMDIRGVTDCAGLRRAFAAAGRPDARGAGLPDEDFDLAFMTLWVEIEPRFGPEPFLVTEWPAPLASLARLKPGDPTVAERMELYGGGLELANGFAELTDPAEQRRRFEANLAQRRAQELGALPLDEAFLAALEEGLPPCAGMALGVDRLAMFAAGCPDIRLVLPFAEEER
jgi:lysyl-tRNA synthetase class 2